MTAFESHERRFSIGPRATMTLLGLGLMLVAALLSRQSPVRVFTSAQSISPHAGSITACGTDVPPRLNIPASFMGPRDGSAVAKKGEPAAAQLIRIWTSGSGTVEVRWPSDVDKRPFTTGQGYMAMTSAGPILATGGTYVRYILLHLPGMQAECETLQVSVFDTDQARLTATVDEITRHPFTSGAPVVSASEDVDSLPMVASCAVPSGVAVTPNRGTEIEGPIGSTPAEALKQFLVTEPGLLQDRYVEFSLPDGSKGYGNRGSTQAFITVVHVISSGPNWFVDRWEASGC